MPRVLVLFSASILGLVLIPTTRAQTVPPCGSAASIDVWVQNDSGQSPITVDVDGAIDAAAVTCTGGQTLAAAYAATVVCSGVGLVRCTDQGGAPASIGGLRPGAWVHRLRVTVPAVPGEAANDAQRQARRGIVVAPSTTSNTRLAATPVVWSVYSFPRAVTTASAADLRAAVAAAQTWTAAHPARRALVTLRPPGPITLDAQRCTPDLR